MPYSQYSSIVLLCIVIVTGMAGAATAGADTMLSRYLSVSAAAPLFAVLLYCLSAHEGFITRFLSMGPLVYLGEISYSLYLVHQIVFRWWLGNKDLFNAPIALQWVIAVGVSLALAAANYHLVERPLRKGILGA